MQVKHRTVLAVIASAALGLALHAGENAPVPAKEDLAKAEALVKELYKKEYAKTKASERAALAAKLLEQAEESKENLAERYVLLREARDLAAKAGDAATAMKAADKLALSFQVGPAEVRAAAASALVAAATTNTGKAIAEALLDASDEAFPVDDWNSALAILKAAEAAARKGQATSLANVAKSRAKRVETIQAEADKVKAQIEVLETKPNDADANLAVGRFLALLKLDWPAGIVHLAMGADAKLKDAAEMDLKAGSGDGKDQLAASEAWYDLATAADGAFKQAMQMRSHYWYKKALPNLEGLAKTKAEKRFAELHAIVAAQGDKSTKWSDIRKAVTDKHTQKLDVVGGGFAQITFEEVPREGGILIGFRCTTTGKGQYPGVVQAIYQTAHGELSGRAYGLSDKTSPAAQVVKAKPGYAVGALYTRGGGGIDAIKPIFMRITDKGLDPKDQYEGPYIGGKGGGEGTLDSKGHFIVGIHGKVENNGRLGAVSLVTLTHELGQTPKKKEPQ